MSLDQARNDLEAYFETQWADATPVGYDGQLFETVYNSVKITIKDDMAIQASFGSPDTNLVRNTGTMIFQIFTEGGKGSATARGYAETIMGLFRNKTIGSVKTKIPHVTANRDEEPYYIINVSVPFVRDEFNA